MSQGERVTLRSQGSYLCSLSADLWAQLRGQIEAGLAHRNVGEGRAQRREREQAQSQERRETRVRKLKKLGMGASMS
eukprot:CAMPEP_0173312484 /NCGR_PEP_ID=MMETSP1143-20121109/24164_1 /TAXON_ID=483371 /ORGANISM="non described non described, Strain CCMP2298" /LENGTH=76 /DNA_ID=CAMNT_0014254697 /DNA_START=59 /DNA_END=286 /DNA_ORIENTATION=+